MKKEKYKLQDLEYGENTENHEKCETHTVGQGIWRETIKNVKNEKCTLQYLDYCGKTEKRGKGDKDTV